MIDLKSLMKRTASLMDIGSSTSNRKRGRSVQKPQSLSYEPLEARQMFSGDTAFLPISGVFSSAENYWSHTPPAVSGLGSSSLVFDINQPNSQTGASSNSRLDFTPVPSEVSNDQPTVIGYLDYFNGVGSHHLRYVTLDVKFGNNLEPLKIEFYVNQHYEDEYIGKQQWPGVSRIMTPVGRSKAYVYGVFPAGTPTPPMDTVSRGSLFASEGTMQRAELRVAFLGIDQDDQFSEATNLGIIDGQAARASRIAHSHDTDTYRFTAFANQRLAFDIYTPYENGHQLDRPQVIVMNAAGARLNRDGPVSSESSHAVYTFTNNGDYYVSVKNKYNKPFAVAEGAHFGMFHGLDDFGWSLNPIPNDATGKYTLKISDADDQISEAIPFGAIWNGSTSRSNRLYSGKDVDMYSFEVTSKGQVLAFDLDRNLFFQQTGRPSIILYGSNGERLNFTKLFHGNENPATNVYGNAPFEYPGLHDAYLEYRFNSIGTYFISVSGQANNTFDPVTGTGDLYGGARGPYGLTVTNVARAYVQFNPDNPRTIHGSVSIPNNPVTGSGFSSPRTISPTLQNHENAPIRSGIETWILIHGRADSASSNNSLAASLQAKLGSTIQVLLLDWSQGAHDNTLLGLQGSKWIVNTSKWVESVMETRFGIFGSKLVMVGHSWGSYMGYEIAKRVNETPSELAGKAKAIVALDPARAAHPNYYNYNSVNFKSVSRFSWAFYGNGSFGSEDLAKTAHESFRSVWNLSSPVSPGPSLRHSAPRGLFKTLVDAQFVANHPAKQFYTEYFNLSRLRQGNLSDDFKVNAFDGFEGAFVYKSPWNLPHKFEFKAPGGTNQSANI